MFPVKVTIDQNKVIINNKVSIFLEMQLSETDDIIRCDNCCFNNFDDYCVYIPCWKRHDKKDGYFIIENKK